MKTAAIICNVVMLAFTALVMLIDGPATEAVYVIFGLLLFAVPLLSVAVLLLRRATGAGPRVAAVAANAVLLGFICWALVDQYPHPAEEGYIPYVVVVTVTPILSIVALSRGGLRRVLPSEPLKG